MTSGNKPIINPYLAVVLGVVGAAFSSIFTKLAEAPPLIIAFYRLGFTVLLLAPVTYVTGRHELRRIGSRDLFLAVLSGVLLAMHFAVWINSLNYTSVASSTVLVTMQPLFVITGGYFLYREKLSRRGLVGAGMALLGSIIIGINDFQVGGQALWGDLLAFAGAIFVAGYVLIGRTLRAHLSLFSYVILVYTASAITLLLCSLAMGLPLYPYHPLTWLWFLLLAIVPTIFGHTVFNWALRYVKAAVVSVSILGEPVGATVLAYFIFHEVPTVLQVLGGIVIISGLYIFITSVVGRPAEEKDAVSENNTAQSAVC
ncbi:drug/metabolite transporter (DMT)-like permease [Desulfohalotomaculum tongense]|uniref:DMT family transporter n=1 Tax=Desulforadius tongensis TaxID=1216062 RepID=UPI001956532C|nr:DMT family transporter [Desulforadius tongensis]MBM7855332.1 drug/metabolite transporter (DMT)-like permease [Desulforadius tongensis]